MLEILVEEDYLRRHVDVFVVDIRRSGAGAVLRLAAPDPEGTVTRMEPTWEDVGPVGEPRPAPTLSLPHDVWDAIAKKAAGALPPSAATDRHLADAIAVRDRLLTMVEDAARPIEETIARA